jgi:hypothetical protein
MRGWLRGLRGGWHWKKDEQVKTVSVEYLNYF